jgi:hypothetical protein
VPEDKDTCVRDLSKSQKKRAIAKAKKQTEIDSTAASMAAADMPATKPDGKNHNHLSEEEMKLLRWHSRIHCSCSGQPSPPSHQRHPPLDCCRQLIELASRQLLLSCTCVPVLAS